MASNLEEIADDELEQLLAQCKETIHAVCDRVEQDLLVASGLRHLMKSADMLSGLDELISENRENATVVLHAAVAALVNSQSMRMIQSEMQRRLSNWN